jgi:hypothetical protein
VTSKKIGILGGNHHTCKKHYYLKLRVVYR